MKTKHLATVYSIVAAALYAINIPLSKILLRFIEPTMMAAFLYLGAEKPGSSQNECLLCNRSVFRGGIWYVGFG